MSNMYSKIVATQDDILSYAEQLPLLNADLAQAIRLEVLRHFGSAPVSLKTLWFFHLSSLEHDEQYNANICTKIFCGVYSCSNAICSLMVGSCSAEEIKEAVSAYLADNPLPDRGSKKTIADIWTQLNLLFRYAVAAKITNINPVQQLIQERDQQRDDMRSTRDALVINSFTQSQASTLFQEAPTDSLQSSEHLGFILCSLGLTTGIVCALNMDDLIIDTLYSFVSVKIVKHIVGNSAESITLENRRHHCRFPIPMKYASHFRAWKKSKTELLTNKGIPLNDQGEYPLLHRGNLDTRLTPRMLNKYCKKKTTSLQRPELIIKIPDGPNTRQDTDLGKFGGSILQSNFDYLLTQHTTMTLDDIAYCKRTKAATVMGNNYCDFACSGIQLGMRVHLDRGLAQLDPRLRHPTPVKNQFSCSSNNYRHIRLTPCNEGTELVINMDLPNCEDGTCLDVSVFADYGATVYIDCFEEC